MEKEKKQRRPMSAKRMIIPAVTLIFLMHVLIIFNTVRINNMGRLISVATQRSFARGAVSGSCSQTTDALGSMALAYVNSGEPEQLSAYLETMGQMEGSYAAMQGLLEASAEEKEIILSAHLSPSADAAASAEEQLTASHEVVLERAAIEKTAIALAAAARGVSPEELPGMAGVALSEELSALSPEQKLERARDMLLSQGYQSRRGDIQRNLSLAVATANTETADMIQYFSSRLNDYQFQQWTLISLIILTMVVMIALLFSRLLIPLEKGLEFVQQGQILPTEQGFSELQSIAHSYDELLRQRNALEADLRERSLTDALTGLPNRLAYEEQLSELDRCAGNQRLTMFSMDVNGLKETNDQKGHRFGDILLRESAACILKAFGDETGKNVFRCGGDEFAAIWKGRTEEEVRAAIELFHQEQQRHGVSISVGFASADNLHNETARALFERADRSMYVEKAAAKRQA